MLFRKYAPLVVFALLAVRPAIAQEVAQKYVLSTYAGGAPPPAPRPVPALTAAIGAPNAVIVHSSGDVYFASRNVNGIYKLDAAGMVTRVAGGALPGFSGDGGPASAARLRLYVGGFGGQTLAVDSAGNLYVADTGNHRVRRISADGIIVTVAGNGAPAHTGDSGPAVNAALDTPIGVAVDREGNLFITEPAAIRKVSRAGVITTIAGTGTMAFSGDGGPASRAAVAMPTAAVVDSTGNLYFADALNNRIRKIDTAGIITTVAGNGTRALTFATGGETGPATDLPLDFPEGLAISAGGDLLIADPAFNRIRVLSPNGVLRPIVGNGAFGFSGDGGPSSSAKLNIPRGVAVDARGSTWIADAGNGRIRRVTSDGTITTVAGGGSNCIDTGVCAPSGDGGPATQAQLHLAIGMLPVAGLAFDRAGNLFIADSGNHRVRKVSPDGVITTVAGTGVPGLSGDEGRATSATLSYPSTVAVDGAGNLFISDTGNGRIRKVSASGTITSVTYMNGAVAVDASGKLYVAAGNVVRVAPDGSVTRVAGNGSECDGFICPPNGDGGPALDARLDARAIAFDEAGNLFIGDAQAMSCDYRIRKVTPDGVITTIAGVTSCDRATCGDGCPATMAHIGYVPSLAVDWAGNVLTVGQFDQKIRKISPDGKITTVASLWPAGWPVAVATDPSGNIFFSDGLNSAVRVLRPNGTPVLAAVADAASARPDPLAPGKIAVLYGDGLGPTQLVQNRPVNGRYGTEVEGTSVTVNGIPAPVLYTSSKQVAIVVPYGASGSRAQVRLSYGINSTSLDVPLTPVAPSLFTANQTGSGQAAAINAATGAVNSATTPLRAGAYIALFATGEGQTAPSGSDGTVAGAIAPRPLLPVSVSIGGIAAEVPYAGGVPGQVSGLMQINARVPEGVQTGGYVPVVLRVGTVESSPAVWIAVSN